MSDIDADLSRAVQARIQQYQPDEIPAFAAIKARHRRRAAVRSGLTAAAAVTVTLAGVTAVPSVFPGPKPPGQLATPPATLSTTPGTAQKPAPHHGPNEADRRAYQRWLATGSPDYTMRMRQTCYCPAHGTVALVTVLNRKVVPSPGTPPGAEPKSIDDLFRIILSGEPDTITVSYNEKYGYPEALDVDVLTNAIDDEQTFRISDYRPVLK